MVEALHVKNFVWFSLIVTTAVDCTAFPTTFLQTFCCSAYLLLFFLNGHMFFDFSHCYSSLQVVNSLGEPLTKLKDTCSFETTFALFVGWSGKKKKVPQYRSCPNNDPKSRVAPM